MSFGPLKVFSVGYSGAVSFSSAFTFPDGITKAFLEIPTLSSGADINIVASTDGTNFRRVMQEVGQTTSVQVNTFTIASAAAASPGRFVPIPVAGPYMKIEPTTAPVSSCTFKIICHY